jgi:ABC-type multidrug transport system fused ATPase/permease subunit
MNNKSSIISIFFEFLNCYPRQFIFLFFLLVIEGLFTAFAMLAIIPLADYFIDPLLVNPSRVTSYVIIVFSKIGLPLSFFNLGILFIISNLLKGVLDVGVKYSILKIKYSVMHGLFGDSLEQFFKAKWGFFSNESNGVLLNTFNKELTTIGDTLGHIATLMAQVIQLFIFLIVPLWLNTTLTLTVLFVSVILGLPFLLLNSLSYRLGKKNTETANSAMGVLNELLQAARLILGYGKQKQSRDKYLIEFKKHTAITLKSQTLAIAIPRLFQPIAMMSVVISVGFSIQNSTPIAEITGVLWSFLAALPILAALLQGNISINNFMPSYEQLVSLRARAKSHEEIQGTNVFSNLISIIEFKDVSFTYPGREKTLHKLNIRIKKGEMTALIGDSGSGKSTITDLLIGLQVPDFGQVLIDGESLNNFKQNSFRERIGYVPQDPILFNCSIRDNLLWSFENASEEDIWDSLQLSNADIFVKELPFGLETFVGDRGVRLSGGQRQRIALARALIRKPELLILDEATSALDTESEKLIQLSIDKIAKETTIFIIAHRLSTISKADQVYILNNGSVIEEGSFRVLSKKNGAILNGMLASQLT